MPAGRYIRTAFLSWLQGDPMPTAPTSLWLHLCTTAPTATTPGTAPVITGYAPVEIEPADWAAIVTGASQDRLPVAGEILIGPFSGSTETATHAMLMDGSDPDTAEIYDYAELADARVMAAGGVVRFAAGAIGVSA
jgi:hypothetical protein